MAKERTAKSKFQSKYTDKWVTAAQWVAEQMCERQARSEKRALSARFWEAAEWAATFRKNVTAASALIREFGEAAVFAAVKRQDVAWCSSLKAKQFRAAVALEKRLADARPTPPPAPLTPGPAVAGPVSGVFAPKKSIRDL